MQRLKRKKTRDDGITEDIIAAFERALVLINEGVDELPNYHSCNTAQRALYDELKSIRCAIQTHFRRRPWFINPLDTLDPHDDDDEAQTDQPPDADVKEPTEAELADLADMHGALEIRNALFAALQHADAE